jgi:hypothetical protein
VQLPEVDVVGAEPGEGGVEGRQQVAARGAAAHRTRTGDAVRLGGDQHLVAGDDVGEQPSEDPLAVAAGVDVGRVDERAAGLAEGDELRRGVVLVGVAPPRHRAEGEPGDDQAAAAEVTLLHAAGP